MAITVTSSFTSGAYGAKATQSCIGIAGAGLPSAFFYTTGTISIKREDDGSVWVKCDALSASQDSMSNANTDGSWGDDDWTLQGFFCNKSSFTLTIDSSGQHASGVNLISAVHMSHEGYGTGNASSHRVYSDAITSKGWLKVADSIDSLEHTSDGETLYLYFAGGVTFSQAVTSAITVNSVKIAFTGQEIPQLFDYVPCAVRSGSDWLSCNREGGKLQLKSGGSWGDLTNSYGDGESHVFIRKDGGWVNSEKIGSE